jgi:hypothetical protein
MLAAISQLLLLLQPLLPPAALPLTAGADCTVASRGLGTTLCSCTKLPGTSVYWDESR